MRKRCYDQHKSGMPDSAGFFDQSSAISHAVWRQWSEGSVMVSSSPGTRIIHYVIMQFVSWTRKVELKCWLVLDQRWVQGQGCLFVQTMVVLSGATSGSKQTRTLLPLFVFLSISVYLFFFVNLGCFSSLVRPSDSAPFRLNAFQAWMRSLKRQHSSEQAV